MSQPEWGARVVVTGLLGTGKTLAVNVLLSCGWDFDEPNLTPQGLEHAAVLRLCGRIAGAHGRATGQPYNAGYVIYTPEEHEAGMDETKQVMPEAVKQPFLGVMPHFAEMYRPEVIVQCEGPEFDIWAEYIKLNDSHVRKSNMPMEHLQMVYEMRHFELYEAMKRADAKVVFFDCTKMEFSAGDQEGFNRLEVNRLDLNARLMALLDDTQGQIGLRPDARVNKSRFKPLRRSLV